MQELATQLRRRGFTLSAAALATGLAAGAVTAAPAGLALSIAGTVFASAGTTGGAGLTSAKVAVMAKLKAGIVGAIVVAGVVTAIFLQHHAKAKLPDESAVVQPQPDQPAGSGNATPASPEIATAARNEPLPEAGSPAPPTAQPSAAIVSLPVRPSAAVPEGTEDEHPGPAVQRYIGRPGSKVRIEGTANMIHPTWQVESPSIGGYFEVGQGFALEPGQTLEPGPVQAQVEAFIPVRSLKSVEPDGRPYSDRMDEIMYEHLK